MNFTLDRCRKPLLVRGQSDGNIVVDRVEMSHGLILAKLTIRTSVGSNRLDVCRKLRSNVMRAVQRLNGSSLLRRKISTTIWKALPLSIPQSRTVSSLIINFGQSVVAEVYYWHTSLSIFYSAQALSAKVVVVYRRGMCIHSSLSIST